MKRHQQRNGSGSRSRRSDDGTAFLPDAASDHDSALLGAGAEELAEEFIANATGADSIHSDANDEVVDAEEGGPFIILDPKGRLPEEDRIGAQANEAHDSVQAEHVSRGALWAARSR